MPIARASVIRGPAVVTYNSQSFYTQGDVKVTVEHVPFDVLTSAFGKVDERVKSRRATCAFTPDGKLTAALAAVLWPFAATAYGASVLSDKDVLITPCTPTGGGVVTSWTLYNAAVSKMPDLVMSANKTLVGEVTFTAIGKDNVDPATAESLIKVDAAATATDAEFTNSDIVTTPYTAAWGSTITGIESGEGFTVSFDHTLEEQVADNYGIVDLLFRDLTLRARFDALNVSEANMATAIAIDKAVGASLLSTTDLTIQNTGGTRKIVITDASPTQIAPQWGLLTLRNGAMEFVSRRKFTSGDPVAQFVITMPA